MTPGLRDSEPGSFFRAALSVLAAVVIIGIALELAFDRHWQNLEQAIAWGGVLLAALALTLLRAWPDANRIRIARVLAVTVLVIAVVGVWRHVVSNYEAAPLDFRFEQRWEQMSFLRRWWAASTGGVGPSPPLAPAVLGQAAACVLLASVGAPTKR